MATGYEKYLTRVGHDNQFSHMSRGLPKPNVCRIEVMDGEARRAYMGAAGFHRMLDVFREQMMESISGDGYDLYEPFYGILDGTNGPSFNVSASWSQNLGNKSGFARMSELITGSGSVGALFKNVPVVGVAVNGIGAVAKTVDKVAATTMDMAGVNNNTTGSMTIKKFTGATIGANVPLKFKWYLPEQEDMCRHALKRLVMMAYVRPMNMSGADIVNKAINGLLNGSGELMDSFGDAWNGFVRGEPYTPSQHDYKDGNSSNSNQQADPNSTLEKIKNGVKSVAAGTIDAYNSINAFFGGEIVANPLPVRVSIGHYLDLEPMVITSVKINCSSEQFVSADGTHLPLFVSADVGVDYWMQPGPTKDFISILGNEVFGQFVKRPPANSNAGKNQNDGKINTNNNPRNGKKR